MSELPVTRLWLILTPMLPLENENERGRDRETSNL